MFIENFAGNGYRINPCNKDIVIKTCGTPQSTKVALKMSTVRAIAIRLIYSSLVYVQLYITDRERATRNTVIETWLADRRRSKTS